MFRFRYDIEEYGWATAWVGNDVEQRELRVSCLHEPLSKMAWLACYLMDGENAGNALYDRVEGHVLFQDEPGAHWLIIEEPMPDVQRQGSGEIIIDYALTPEAPIGFSLQRHSEYFFGTGIPATATEIMRGNTTVRQFSQSVLEELQRLLNIHSFSGFRERWIEYEFPLTETARLAKLLGHKSFDIRL
ncbi:MAG: hypothetical protein WCO51_09375 [bacterium]|jgi:hypothetical protein